MKERTYIEPLRIVARLGALVLGVAIGAATASADTSERPYLRPDGSWISLSGTVKSVGRDAFTLDFGDGLIIVEMDDGDRDSDGYALLEDDRVVVVGRIDDDFYETTKIEASSVYVEKLGTYFYASPIDDERFFEIFPIPVEPAEIRIQGTVTEVGDDRFVLDSEIRSLTIDTSALAADPLDDEGYQKIEPGDIVSVAGRLTSDLLEGRTVQARSVIELVD